MMLAEYFALPTAMREVIPFERVDHCLQWNSPIGHAGPRSAHPWSKHYAIKVHWFRSHLKPNQIVLHVWPEEPYISIDALHFFLSILLTLHSKVLGFSAGMASRHATSLLEVMTLHLLFYPKCTADLEL
jgi:hypothetical protein